MLVHRMRFQAENLADIAVVLSPRQPQLHLRPALRQVEALAESGRVASIGVLFEGHDPRAAIRRIRQLHERKGYHETLIAIANKHARMLWAMLAKGERYDAGAWQRHPMHPPLLPAATA